MAARHVRRAPDWSSLPDGVLQKIFCQASTWQRPGTCLAAPVCRSWRSAALGRRGLRLLYHAGRYVADQSFATWLVHNSPLLGALIIYTSAGSHAGAANVVLAALMRAVTAAAAAGQPLELHTLRVLGPGPNLAITGRLLSGLPYLRVLQLVLDDPGDRCLEAHAGMLAVQQGLGPLQQATQLQQLHLKGPHMRHDLNTVVAGLLPPSLERFSWQPRQYKALPDLCHLQQATFLRLTLWEGVNLTSNRLPPGLQELQLCSMVAPSELLLEQQEVLTAWHADRGTVMGMQQQVGSLQRVHAATAQLGDVRHGSVHAALGLLPELATLSATSGKGQGPGLAAALARAGSLQGLRRLDLQLRGLPFPTGLSALAALTRLRVAAPDVNIRHMTEPPQRCAWLREISRMEALRWLSVPAAMLETGPAAAVEPPLASLGGLQQLRVLALTGDMAGDADGVVSWLDDHNYPMVPPQLQVLGWGGVPAERAASCQLRSRLRQLLGNSECMVLVGVDLDEVADPALQLAGVPAALQQVLLG